MNQYTSPTTKKIGRYTPTLVGILVIGLVGFAMALLVLPCVPTQKLTLNETSLVVCRADTLRKQTKGLSGSYALPRVMGMLFVFDDSQMHSFWMKNMHYPIDIIWLDSEFTITEVARNVQPASYPGVFTPRLSHKYVLETAPGVIPGEYPKPLFE